MRTIAFDPLARDDFLQQLDYLIANHAFDAALNLERQFKSFLYQTLATFPLVGHSTSRPGIFESVVPHTRLLVWYRFTEDTIEIVRIWHSSQTR